MSEREKWLREQFGLLAEGLEAISLAHEQAAARMDSETEAVKRRALRRALAQAHHADAPDRTGGDHAMNRNLPAFVVQVLPLAGDWRTTDGPNHFPDRWKAEARRAQLHRRSPHRQFRIIETTITTTRKGA